METITTKVQIDSNGVLRLELPTGLSPGPVDVVLVVNRAEKPTTGSATSLSGRFAAFASRDIDPIEEVREIRRRTNREAQELPE